MKPIIPHLWFDTDAVEAANLYVSLFDDSKVTRVSQLHGTPTPSGDSDIVSFELCGQPFMAISAGPVFTPNPSISFFVFFDPAVHADAKERLEAAHAKLLEGGKELMPLQEYPFSPYYAWVQDKWGFTWQLMLTTPGGSEGRPLVMTSLMFTKPVAGRAEEAMEFYSDVFDGSERGPVHRYPEGAGDDAGTILHADIKVHETWLSFMDSAGPHAFTFNEGVSLVIPCDTQEEIDAYSEKLSAVPEAEQCGWLKDKFGVSWQVYPSRMDEMMATGTQEQIDRVTQAFLPMKRFDLAALERAFAGE